MRVWVISVNRNSTAMVLSRICSTFQRHYRIPKQNNAYLSDFPCLHWHFLVLGNLMKGISIFLKLKQKRFFIKKLNSNIIFRRNSQYLRQRSFRYIPLSISFLYIANFKYEPHLSSHSKIKSANCKVFKMIWLTHFIIN